MFAKLSYLDIIWLVIGFSGQILFSMRFILQWIYSEKYRKSIIPISFWYFSLLGGITLLAYANSSPQAISTSGYSFYFCTPGGCFQGRDRTGPWLPPHPAGSI